MTKGATRREVLIGSLAFATGTGFSLHQAGAQNWPTQPIKLIVGGAAGSIPDTLARIAGDSLSKGLGQPIIIDNRPGAGGIAAIQGLIKSEPDGYTIGLATISQTIFNSYLYSKLTYEPRRDLLPISTLAATSFVLAANPTIQTEALADVIALSNRAPDKLLIGVPANGSPPHIAAILLLKETKLNASFIPFRSGPDALRAAIRGDIHLLVDGPTLIAAQVEDRKLKAIVVTGRQREITLPDVPTIAEAGFGTAECESWMGLVAPSGTPPNVVARLSHEIRTLLESDAYRSRLTAMSFRPQFASPDDFATLIKLEHQRWSTVLEATGLKLD